MKPTLTLALAVACICATAVSTGAQSLSQQVIGTAGNEMLTPNLAFSYTIGEPCVNYYVGQFPIVTEGFQQNTVVIVSVEAPPESVRMKVYPNPFDNAFTVEHNLAAPQLVVTDALGRAVPLITQHHDAGRIGVALSAIPSGVYLLTVLEQHQPVAVYRIVKTTP